MGTKLPYKYIRMIVLKDVISEKVSTVANFESKFLATYQIWVLAARIVALGALESIIKPVVGLRLLEPRHVTRDARHVHEF